MLGENSCRGTPSSIPNLEVKPVNAESTWREASWEDRNLPSIMSASLAQSVEHAAVNRSVNGSSPLGSAIFLFFGKFFQKEKIKNEKNKCYERVG